MHQVLGSCFSRSGGVPKLQQQQQEQRKRCISSASFGRLPAGTRYPPRLPSSLDFRKGGFVLRQPTPAPPPPQDGCCSSASSSTTTKLITRHLGTLSCLRGRSHSRESSVDTGKVEEPPKKDADDVITGAEQEDREDEQQHEDEELEEESEVLLTLSESSCSSEEEQENEEEKSESEQEVTSEEEEEELEENQLFAKDYLRRVRPHQLQHRLLSVVALTQANSRCCYCVAGV